MTKATIYILKDDGSRIIHNLYYDGHPKADGSDIYKFFQSLSLKQYKEFKKTLNAVKITSNENDCIKSYLDEAYPATRFFKELYDKKLTTVLDVTGVMFRSYEYILNLKNDSFICLETITDDNVIYNVDIKKLVKPKTQ